MGGPRSLGIQLLIIACKAMYLNAKCEEIQSDQQLEAYKYYV